MATPTEKLAASLEVLRELQRDDRRIFRSAELSRVHRERLQKAGVLQPVMKGWLMLCGVAGERREGPAHAAFWEFCTRYCTERFGSDWHVSAEQSLLLWADAAALPERVVVHTPHGTNNTVVLPFGTSIYDLKDSSMPEGGTVVERAGLRLLDPAAALIRVPESSFVRHPAETRMVLAALRDVADLLRFLLEGGHSAVAGRVAGAFRHVGRAEVAEEILRTMKSAGYDVREADPFAVEPAPGAIGASVSPLVARMQELWESMRETVIRTFPPPAAIRPQRDAYLQSVDEVYPHDAYHSLAMEGFRVTPALIERGRWSDSDATGDEESGDDRDAAAARGYWQAFRSVRETVAQVLAGANAGALARTAHLEWRRQLRQPFVSAGLIEPSDEGSQHGSGQPAPRWKAVRDAVPALFDLLERESEASVRAVLGHWMFGYIHRYTDDDGRLARFLLNVMLASGGYPWTVIRVEDRNDYIAALDGASADAGIEPLARFIGDRVPAVAGPHPD